jgi:hypothetical protein
VQPWTGPEGSRSLRLPDFNKIAHVYPQEKFLVLIAVRGWSDPSAVGRPEGLCSPSEIKPVSFWLLAQYFNQMRHRVTKIYSYTPTKLPVHNIHITNFPYPSTSTNLSFMFSYIWCKPAWLSHIFVCATYHNGKQKILRWIEGIISRLSTIPNFFLDATFFEIVVAKHFSFSTFSEDLFATS